MKLSANRFNWNCTEWHRGIAMRWDDQAKFKHVKSFVKKVYQVVTKMLVFLLDCGVTNISVQKRRGERTHIWRNGTNIEHRIVHSSGSEVDIIDISLHLHVIPSSIEDNLLQHPVIIFPSHQPLIDREKEWGCKGCVEPISLYVYICLPQLTLYPPASSAACKHLRSYARMFNL